MIGKVEKKGNVAGDLKSTFYGLLRERESQCLIDCEMFRTAGPGSKGSDPRTEKLIDHRPPDPHPTALPPPTPAPATTTPAPVTPPSQTPTGPPKTPQAPKSKPRDIVLARPQSAFTFTCARPASTTTLPRTVATRNLASLNAAAAKGTPQTAKPPLSLFTKAELGGVQPEKGVRGEIRISTLDFVFGLVYKGKGAPSKAAIPVPGSAKAPLGINTGVPTSPPTFSSSERLSQTLNMIPVTPASKDEVTGWPDANPTLILPGPATRDGKSRFFPTLSTLSIANGSNKPTPTPPSRAPSSLPVVSPPPLSSPSPAYQHRH